MIIFGADKSNLRYVENKDTDFMVLGKHPSEIRDIEEKTKIKLK